ncbi:hypothetical protein SKAU_G00036500 [Synaphobranchus kaupii]|uniref:Uncharacterized protein n=1 Tax=Synaphobranchus kaupii TaxID=118154 RepID=A0A9Q1JGQ6_SYNKA|nr:hypothetical protein SKAU_G00036500 [Synaphobranchus kaupii]
MECPRCDLKKPNLSKLKPKSPCISNVVQKMELEPREHRAGLFARGAGRTLSIVCAEMAGGAVVSRGEPLPPLPRELLAIQGRDQNFAQARTAVLMKPDILNEIFRVDYPQCTGQVGCDGAAVLVM